MMSPGRTFVALLALVSLACASLPHSHFFSPAAPQHAVPSEGASVNAWQAHGSAPCAACVSQRLLQHAQLQDSPGLAVPTVHAAEPPQETSILPSSAPRTARPRAPPSC